MTDALLQHCRSIINDSKRISRLKIKQLITDQNIKSQFDSMGLIKFAWHIVHNTWSIPTCAVCANQVKWLDAKRRYGLSCSRKCSNINPDRLNKIKRTMLETYGSENASQVESIKERKRATTQKNHGVNYPSQHPDIHQKQLDTTKSRHGVEYAMQSPVIQQQYKKTMFDRYGVENAVHSKELTDKRLATFRELFGVDHPSQNQSIKDKKRNTMQTIWKVNNPSQHPDIQNKKTNTFIERYGVLSAAYIGKDSEKIKILLDKELFEQAIIGLTIKQAADLLEVDIVTIYDKSKKYECRSLFKDSPITNSYELKITNLLDEYDIKYIKHDRKIIAPNELDIVIPELNIAIEVGSAYWHGEENGRDKMYHFNKWKRCKDKGITLLQFFDEDISNHWELTKSKILRLLNKSKLPIIGARKMEIYIPTHFEEKLFFNTWHVKGYSPVRNIAIGAKYNSMLVAILTIKIKGNIAKIERWATNVNTSYPGLYSRLLKYWIVQNNFKGTIETWSDNRLGNGKVYESSGFVEKEISTPGYWYFKNDGLENRINYQRHKLQKLFNLTDEENRKELTEWDIMRSQGYDRLWDAGHTKWIKEIK